MKKLIALMISFVMVFMIPASSMAANNFKDEVLSYKSLMDMTYQDARSNSARGYKAIVVINQYSAVSDGLSASGLVGASDGVLFALDFDSPEKMNLSEERLSELLGGNKKMPIYFIGGEAVIPDYFKRRFYAEGYNCITLSGKDRIKTSYSVAQQIKKIKGSVKEIAITNGYKGIPDAVSIAGAAVRRKMPVVLTNGKNVPFSTSGLKTYAIGGTAVMSNSIVNQTKATRLAGADRYKTNRAILRHFGLNQWGNFDLVYGIGDESLNLASIVGCSRDTYPLVLYDEKKSDMSILKGAKRVEYKAVNARKYTNTRVQAYNATFGNDVVTAQRSILKHVKGTEEARNDVMGFIYNETDDNYVANSPKYNYYRQNFYIFDVYNTRTHKYEPLSILVRKSDKKVYTWKRSTNKLEALVSVSVTL